MYLETIVKNEIEEFKSITMTNRTKIMPPTNMYVTKPVKVKQKNAVKYNVHKQE